MDGMGQEALKNVVQSGAVYDMLYNPADEFMNKIMFSEETSTFVCKLKNLSKKEMVNEFVLPLVAIDRALDRIVDRAITLLLGITLTEKGDPVT
jgi:ABC-type proline/glycine betaine transport system ATPase subunit